MNEHHGFASSQVVITGLGVKSPAGNTVKEAFDAILAGRSMASLVQALRDSRSRVDVACTVPDFDVESYFSPREMRRVDRASVLASAAATDAVRDAGLESSLAAERVAVAVGTGGAGPVAAVESRLAVLTGDEAMPTHAIPMYMPSAPAGLLSLRLAVEGPSLTYSTACASGTTALGEGLRMIRAGLVDVVVAGGVETPLTPVVINGFHQVRALSRNPDPATASRPFDAGRDGFVIGEGAAFVVLERWDHARARGASLYAELAGYATNSDAYHIVAPREDGSVAARCMSAALADAGLSPKDVGHINAHGTSTVLNDQAESHAIVRCFGQNPPPVTACKGVTGHMIGASGAFEAAMAALSLRDCVIPPVANHVRQSGEPLLDVVTGVPRRVRLAAAISNSFGFGGHNASLVLAPVV